LIITITIRLVSSQVQKQVFHNAVSDGPSAAKNCSIEASSLDQLDRSG